MTVEVDDPSKKKSTVVEGVKVAKNVVEVLVGKPPDVGSISANLNKSLSPEQFLSKKTVQPEKKKAAEFVKKATKGHVAAEEEVAKLVREHQEVNPKKVNVKRQLAASLKSENAKGAAWLVKDAAEFDHHSFSASFVSRIARAPQELQGDPNWLFMEGVRFNNSVKWAELSPEAFKEATQVATRLSRRVLELAEIHKDFLPSDTMVSEWMTPEGRQSHTPPPDPLFTGIVPPVAGAPEELPQELQDSITKIEQHFSSTQVPLPHTAEADYVTYEDMLESARKEAEKQTGHQLTQDQIPTYNEYLNRIRETRRELQARRVQSERRQGDFPSPLFVSEREKTNAIQDPAGTGLRIFGKVIDGLLDNPSGSATEVAFQRLKLMEGALQSDEFVDMRRVFLEDAEHGGVAWTDAEIREFREAVAPIREEYLRSFSTMLNAVQYYEKYSKIDGFRDNDFQAFLKKVMTERDFLSMPSLMGGLVGEAAALQQLEYAALVPDDRTIDKTLNDSHWEEATVRTIERMRENADLYKPMYEEWIRGDTMVAGGRTIATLGYNKAGERVAPTYEEAIKTIAHFGKIQNQILANREMVDVRAPAPLQTALRGGEHFFVGKSKIMRQKRYIRFNYEKWTNTSGEPSWEKAVYSNQGRLFARNNPEVRQYARETADSLWARVENFQRSHGHVSADEERLLMGDVKYNFFYDANHPDMGAIDHEFVEHLTHDDIYEQTLVRRGLDVSDMFHAKTYHWAASGFRGSVFASVMEARLKEVLPADTFAVEGPKGLFVAYRVTQAADAYVLRKLSGDSHEYRSKYLSTIYEAAGWRPIEIAEPLSDMKSDWFADWYQRSVASGAIPQRFTNNQGEFFRENGQIGRVLHGQLMEHLAPAVDLSLGEGGLSADQVHIARKVFEARVKGNRQGLKTYFQAHQGDPTFLGQLGLTHGVPAAGFEALTPQQRVDLGNIAAADLAPGEMREYFASMQAVVKFLREPYQHPLPANTQQLLRAAQVTGSVHFGGQEIHEDHVGALRELCDMRYMPLMVEPRWTYDFPMDMLEKPELVKIRAQRVKKNQVFWNLLSPDRKARIEGVLQPLSGVSPQVADLAALRASATWSTLPLENQQEIQGILQRALQDKNIPLSVLGSGARGNESAGLMHRWIGDFIGGEELWDVLPEIFKLPNAEKLPDLMLKVQSIVNPIYGPEYASIAMQSYEAAFLESARVYPAIPAVSKEARLLHGRKRYGHGNMLEGMQNSSDMKTHKDHHALSISPDEVRDEKAKVQALVGKYVKSAPVSEGLFETAEEMSDVTAWGSMLGGHHGWGEKLIRRIPGMNERKYHAFVEFLNERFPSGIIKMKLLLLPLYLAIFLALYTGTEASSGGTEAKPGH